MLRSIISFVVLLVLASSSVGATSNAPDSMPDEQDQGYRQLSLSSSCDRFATFGSGGINSEADLNTEGWTTDINKAKWYNYRNNNPSYMTFVHPGTPNGYIETTLPNYGDFIRVRFGNVECFQCTTATTHVMIAGDTVGTAINGTTDVTIEASYDTGNKLRIAEIGYSFANVWSIDICTYDVPAAEISMPGACFHGDGTVLLETGLTKRLSELSLGDRIQTSDGQGGFSFNAVTTLPHANNTERAVFLILTTETGKKVDMTPDHFIPTCGNKGEGMAGELVIGDCILTVDGKETLSEISSAVKNGVYTAITPDKYIVVDRIVVSPYSKNFNPSRPAEEYDNFRLELEKKRNRKLYRHKQKSRSVEMLE